MKERKKVPTGVKVISILYYVFAGLAVISAIMLFVGANMVNSILGQIPIIGIIGAFGSSLFIVAGIISLTAGILGFFIGRGLWNAGKWARTLVIIFSCIGVLMGIISLAKPSFIGIFSQLVVSGGIGGYLIFSKKVKKAFA